MGSQNMEENKSKIATAKTINALQFFNKCEQKGRDQNTPNREKL
jgi:hypothetical protein